MSGSTAKHKIIMNEYVLVENGQVLAGANNLGNLMASQLDALNDLLSMVESQPTIILKSEFEAQ